MKRLSVVLGVFLSTSVPAVAAAPLGNVTSNTTVMRNGYKVGCVSALLIPRSPTADRNVRLVFGSLDKGKAKAADVLSERPPGTRESRCNRLQTKGNYLFADVAPGQYYVVLRFRRTQGASDKADQAPFDGMLMRRTSVSPGATARLRFD
jgi:hypothetical protein